MKLKGRKSTNVEDRRVPQGAETGFVPGLDITTEHGKRLLTLLDALIGTPQQANLGWRTQQMSKEFNAARDVRQQWGLEKLLWLLNGKQGEFTPSGQ